MPTRYEYSALSRFVLFAALLLPSLLSLAERAVIDGYGRLKAVTDGDEQLIVETRLALALPGWKQTTAVQHGPGGPRPAWSPHALPESMLSSL